MFKRDFSSKIETPVSTAASSSTALHINTTTDQATIPTASEAQRSNDSQAELVGYNPSPYNPSNRFQLNRDS